MTDDAEGAGSPPPEPAPLVAGAIGRSLSDAADAGIWAAYGRYQVRLEELRGGPTVQD
jgi:hypothetical protein